MRSPNTRPSSSELLASRLPPCRPEAATSPQAHKPASECGPRHRLRSRPCESVPRSRPEAAGGAHRVPRARRAQGSRETRGEIRDAGSVEPGGLARGLQRSDAARDDVARRQFGIGMEGLHEAVAGIVEQHRTRAAKRLGQQGKGVGIDRERGRVKLHEFEVGEAHAARAAAARPAPREVPGLVVRSKQAPMPPVASTTCGASTASRDPSRASSSTPPARFPQVTRSTSSKPSSTRMSGRCDRRMPHRAHDRGAGAVAAGVDDAMAAVSRFAAERRLAGTRQVEVRRRAGAASRSLPGRPGYECRDFRVRKPGGDAQRISGVQGRGVAAVERGGDAALREFRGAAADRLVGDEDAAAAATAPSRVPQCRRRRRRRAR